MMSDFEKEVAKLQATLDQMAAAVKEHEDKEHGGACCVPTRVAACLRCCLAFGMLPVTLISVSDEEKSGILKEFRDAN